jgi:hypothetical protein
MKIVRKSRLFKTQRKGPFGKPRHAWEDNSEIDHRKIQCDGMYGVGGSLFNDAL